MLQSKIIKVYDFCATEKMMVGKWNEGVQCYSDTMTGLGATCWFFGVML